MEFSREKGLDLWSFSRENNLKSAFPLIFIMERTILHADMNNFFASVECFLNPKLKPYPVAVCGNVEERHGIVLAKNYKAKSFGVRTGEAIWQAKQKCPALVVVNPHYEEYMKFSKAAREIYGYYTDQVEAFGLDECWLDVSGLRCFSAMARRSRTRYASG